MEDITKTLINPFQLLGINYDSSELELKKSYYKLSLLCHPDKGGDKNDMIILSKAYKYAKEQITNKTEKKYEQIQEEFDTFCKEQEEKECESFGNIYEETNEWISEFNSNFIKKQKEEQLENESDDNSKYTNNPYSLENGYGDLMDVSTLNVEDITNNNCLYDENNNDIKENKNQFKSEIIIYKEPKTISHFKSNPFSLVDKNITDFSTEKSLDYIKAFSPPENVDVDDSRLNIKTNDIESFNKYYENLMKERNLNS